MRYSYTWKIIKKLNSLITDTDSINLIPQTLAPWRRLNMISPTMKKLIKLKDLLLATHLSPLFPPIKNILPNAKLKEQILHEYCREG